jgi:membrane-anchored protein YejM (alkaline phosphatase superfamily)
MKMLNAKEMIGTHDVLWITLDTLRYDVACEALASGRTPNLARWLPGGKWETRHSPGNFTFAAHAAFFAGFLPTPASPGKSARLFAAAFPGSETTTPETCVFDAPDVVSGLAARDYRTICIGGVGFFNKRSPLGSVLPGLFQESYWAEELGVTCRDSTAHQVALACERLANLSANQRVFLFVNVSALHQPNCMYLSGETTDSPCSMAAALAYVDEQLPPLIAALQRRAPTLCVVCADHGTAYGEDGYWGHRLAHEVVWTVPYTEFVLPRTTG